MGTSRNCINQEFTNTNNPELKNVTERALGIILNAALAARIQARILFPHVESPPSETFVAAGVHWACEALNHTPTTSNPANKSRQELWYGKAAPTSPHPCLCRVIAAGTARRSRFQDARVVLSRAGHRTPPCLIVEANAGEQGSGDKGRQLGDSSGIDGAAYVTAAAGLPGTGKGAIAGRDVRAGRSIIAGRDAGAMRAR